MQKVLEYHNLSKHTFNTYAPGPRGLDWQNQPNPFRKYVGSRLMHLNEVELTEEPFYNTAFKDNGIEPEPINIKTISQFFYDSLALSAWKQAGPQKWSLRINPSSGNLQPTEAYLISGPVEGIARDPFIAHYSPKEHSLEIRLEFPYDLWKGIILDSSAAIFLLGLTSIHWRTSWKYGERSFRYVNLDLGHALAALGLAARGLGWNIRLLGNISHQQLIPLLGLSESVAVEPEYPDCLLAIIPSQQNLGMIQIPDETISAISEGDWKGTPNKLSEEHVDWPYLTAIAKEVINPSVKSTFPHVNPFLSEKLINMRQISLRRIIHQRRSALGMDQKTAMPRNDFYQLLRNTTIPLLPWGPFVHFALFIHRVTGLQPGLYFFTRDEASQDELKEELLNEFVWQKPTECPDELNLYLLTESDARKVARSVSCHQEIASDGCFSLGMISSFMEPLKKYGAWFYPRLYWECGMLGQLLYLGAELIGFRACGIGCYFDDPIHDLLGIKGLKYQDLYHFSVGKPVEDPRLTTLPPYSD